ncbi:hypothetical protein ABOONEI_2266 [Aciduliprofundum boonei T469]|nr:hypothetical protein ABOONEI_2266 [Aciduliprofundum boonei T469]
MKAIYAILGALLILFLPMASASTINFEVNSPKITDKFVDYDILKVFGRENATTVKITIVVWGMINVAPQKGYIKEYDVNITSDSYYVHCFLVSNNGSKPLGYVMLGKKPHIVNYTINTSQLTWFVPRSFFENITDNYTVNAYAGIADISKQEFIFLDHAVYPPPPVEEGQSVPYEYYLLTAATVFALGIVIYLEIKRIRAKK